MQVAAWLYAEAVSGELLQRMAASLVGIQDLLLVVTGVERRVSWIHLVGALKFHPGSPSDVLTFLVHCVHRLALRQQELVCTEKAVR